MKNKFLDFANHIKKKVYYIIWTLLILSVFWIFLYYKFNFFKNIWNDLLKWFHTILDAINYPIVHTWTIKLSIWNILIFLAFVIIWLFIAWYYKQFVYSVRKKYKISYWTATILANIGYYTILFTIWLSSVKIIWIDLSSFTLIAWALSVGIWFWLKNIISNFVSGIILMFEKSIKVWDYIELQNETRWKVVDIKIRSTTIKTNDNIDLIIPNQDFIDGNIINRTLNDNKVRFKIPFWVAYWTKIKDVEKAILWALKDSKLNYLKSGDYTPTIVMRWMNNSSVDFWLYIWIKWEDIFTPNRTRSNFLKLIYNALYENNITIPFPQTDLHIKDSIPLEIKIKNE